MDAAGSGQLGFRWIASPPSQGESATLLQEKEEKRGRTVTALQPPGSRFIASSLLL